MKILIVGAGPAGLSLASRLKRSSPLSRVQVIEQRAESESAGLGITLPRAMAEEAGCSERDCFPLDRSCTWYRGANYLTTPIGLVAVARDAMLARLRRRCELAGVSISFGHRLESLDEVAEGGYDLIVGADGVNSVVRLGRAEWFGSSVRHVNSYHAWLATPKLFETTLTRIFQEYRGWLFMGWGYQFSSDRSALIVQAGLSAITDSGVRVTAGESGAGRLGEIFQGVLGGSPLVGAGQRGWTRFTLLKNRTWHAGNAVLLGDAAHTAHFSRGFGTADALGDALSLSRNIASFSNLELSLEAFERDRMPAVALHQSAALSASNWHERIVSRHEQGHVSAITDALREALLSIPPVSDKAHSSALPRD